MRKLPLADQLRIGSPCSVGDAWDAMHERADGARYCASCQKEVHDVASLTRDEVLALLRTGDRLCLRIHRRRADGAVLLADGHALPSERLATRGLAAAVATMSAAALAGCGSPPPLQPTQYVHIAPSPPPPALATPQLPPTLAPSASAAPSSSPSVTSRPPPISHARPAAPKATKVTPTPTTNSSTKHPPRQAVQLKDHDLEMGERLNTLEGVGESSL